MNTEPYKYWATTPDGYTVSATTNIAIVECLSPEGVSVAPGILGLSKDGVLVYKTLDPTRTLSSNGLKALAEVMDDVKSDMDLGTTSFGAAVCEERDRETLRADAAEAKLKKVLGSLAAAKKSADAVSQILRRY